MEQERSERELWEERALRMRYEDERDFLREMLRRLLPEQTLSEGEELIR